MQAVCYNTPALEAHTNLQHSIAVYLNKTPLYKAVGLHGWHWGLCVKQPSQSG
jgi:hypothetical protein